MIIESGLDIPSVNTLIVNRADRLGLAQLYQLRGRVGRSSHKAYAYFLVPRYIRVLDELPKTASAKVQKHVLRAEGITEDSWDREAHGIKLRREKLS